MSCESECQSCWFHLRLQLRFISLLHSAALLLPSHAHLQYKVLASYFTCFLLFDLSVPVALMYFSDHFQLPT